MCIRDREKLKRSEPEIFLIDGNKIPPVKNKDINLFSIIKGDAKSALIGLASIIAKEYRDKLMGLFDEKFPQYGFSFHSGYPTKRHKDVLSQIGPCPIHRRTFKGVKEWTSLVEKTLD